VYLESTSCVPTHPNRPPKMLPSTTTPIPHKVGKVVCELGGLDRTQTRSSHKVPLPDSFPYPTFVSSSMIKKDFLTMETRRSTFSHLAQGQVVGLVPVQFFKVFEEAAKQDIRFTCTVGYYWEYKSFMDILVQLDFIDKHGVGRCLHKLSGYTLADGVPMATFSDLPVVKR